MLRRRRRWRYGVLGAGLVVVLAAAAGGIPRLLSASRAERRPAVETLATTAVRRADLWAKVTAGGTVGSAKQTVVQCELRNMDAGVRGFHLSTGGASTILSLVPEGTMVKQGQVLCELDASGYEEVLRLQEMTVQRARADHEQARLDLDVARTALREFRDGTLMQMSQDFEGRIALARSEWERAGDRLGWSRRMFAKGYMPTWQLSSEAVAQRRASIALAQSRTAYEVFRRYNAPRTLRELESAVIGTEQTWKYQSNRLTRHLGRLEALRLQIERCTIRAPHDGFLIYATDPRRRFVIEPGLAVRQNQPLFVLPDLGRMEVSTLLHESVVDRVHDGMRAKVRVEALEGRILEGHVESIAVLPTRNWFDAVPYYIALVKLDSAPRGLLPGMSAEIEIATARRPDVLTIPPAAVAVEDGRKVCYVAGSDGLERREVEVGEADRDQLEVTRGLAEGEQVVLDPSHLADAPEAVAQSDAEGDEPATPDAAFATH